MIKIIKKFRKIDANGDGKLSKQELMQGFKEFKNDDTEDVAYALFEQLERQNVDFIDFKGFVSSFLK